MKKLTKLSVQQQECFTEYVDKWTEIGLSTDPTDHPRAESGIIRAYEIAGFAPPEKIVWCGSPLAQCLTRIINLPVGNSIDNNVNFFVWHWAWNSVHNLVRESVWDLAWDSVLEPLQNLVKRSVKRSVLDSVVDSIGSVVDSIGASIKSSAQARAKDSAFGQHEAGILGFMDYFADVCGMAEQTKRLVGIWEVAKSAGWWAPYEKICWVSERHNILNRNGRGQLHCENGPALAYPDGWSIWAVDGVRVDEQIITSPETQTVKQIKTESNEEVRRIRIERFGWERYLKESGAKRLERRRNDRDAQIEELFRLDDGTQRFVCVDPSTGRRYALGVPSNVKTCQEAQNWINHGGDVYITHRS